MVALIFESHAKAGSPDLCRSFISPQAPFPEGESYQDTSRRMKGHFCTNSRNKYDGKTIMVIGHRATQYGLEEHIRGIPLADVVVAAWKWQPGWTYTLA
jgi:2,3-bisphosphoglycerate-dependent phosphoglycerate mutase